MMNNCCKILPFFIVEWWDKKYGNRRVEFTVNGVNVTVRPFKGVAFFIMGE